MSSSNQRMRGPTALQPAAGRSIKCLVAAGIGIALAAGQGIAVDYTSDTRGYNLAHGRVVFEQYCTQCHETGRLDAPVFGDVADWSQRLEQPLDSLVRHAIEGHGRMPPKGDLALSDQQVAAAVAFVVERTRNLVQTVDDLDSLPPTAAGGEASDAPRELNANASVIQMFMLLYGKERWR